MPLRLSILKDPTVAYTAPFVVFVGLLALERQLGIAPELGYLVRFVAVSLVLLLVSRRVIPIRPSAPVASAGLGLLVFAIWVGPDVLFGPSYRHHWVFENPVLGQAASSAPETLKSNIGFIVIRFLGAAVLVPILEELFWRGWLMRWLTEHEFLKAPVGAYSPMAFWTVAILFASEHGPYWEVGLLAGIAYNWWCIRTRNLADCILAHSVTNAILSGYVLFTGQWQYWL